MHILVLCEAYPTDDNPVRGIFYRQQAQALHKAGDHVGVVAPIFRSLRAVRRGARARFYGTHIEDDHGVPTYLFYDWSWFGKRGYGSLWMRQGELLFRRYVADQGKPDLIHAHNGRYAGMLAQKLAEEAGIPYVLTEHSTAYARDLIPAREVDKVKAAFRGAERRIVVSSQLGRLLEQQLGDAVVPWQLIPNVLGERFTRSDCEPQPSLSSEFTFLNVGLMTSKKGQGDLLTAFAGNFKGAERFVLRLGGDGPSRPHLEQLSVELGIQDQVTFLGLLRPDQVVEEMKQCDVFVLSSHYETFGVVLIEALACGKPVVATACGGPEDIVRPDNGILVEPMNTEALGSAMLQLVESYADYDQSAIRTDCLSRYGETEIVASLSQVYRSLKG